MSKFRNFSTTQHIYLGLFVWFFASIIILLFRVNSEAVAPYTYFFAAIISFVFLAKRSPKQHFWPNVMIFIFTILLLLDESAYGAEVFNFEPIYWQKYDYHVRDLHNLVPGLIGILNVELRATDWDFGRFMKMDLLIMGLSLVYVVICQFRIRKKNHIDQIRKIAIDLASIFLIGYALFTIYQVISLPVDPKNVWLFGYSKYRMILFISICIYIGFLVAIYFNVFDSKLKILRFLTHIIDRNGLKVLVWFSLGLGALIIFFYQVIVPFSPFPNYKAAFSRLTPIVFFIAVSLIFVGLALINWNGILFRSSSNYKHILSHFLRRYPGYVYLGFVVIQIFFSTLVDQDLISSGFILWKLLGNAQVGVQLEEAFEMIASFELIVAGATFRYNNFSLIEGNQ